MANEFIVRNGLVALADSQITGSLSVSGAITGSGAGLTNIPSSGLTAPGSDTQILYNSDGSLAANSGLVYSGSRIGIGTSSPAAQLHLVNSGGSWDRHISIEYNASNIGNILVDNEGMKLRNMSSGNNFYFRNSDNSTQLFISSSGVVGIGSPFSIAPDGSGNRLIVGSGVGNQGMTIYSGDSNLGSIYFADDLDEEGTGDSPVGSRDASIRYDHANNRFGFYTTGNQHELFIKYGGSTFQNNLTVNGNLTVGGIVTAQEFHTKFVSASIVYQSGSTQFGNSFDDTHIFSGSIILNGGITGDTPKVTIAGNDSIIRLGDNHSGGPHGLQFDYGAGNSDGMSMYYRTSPQQIVFENSTGASGTAVMAISRSGAVGIGTTNPLYNLHVVGSTYVNSGTLFVDSGQYIRWGNSAQGIRGVNDTSLEFVAGSSTRMYVSSSGNVGIGTTSPTNKLDIRPTTSGGSDTAGTGAITIGSDNPYWTFRGTATSLQDLAFDRSYAGTWYESMRIQRSTGNVGIGTSAPDSKLHVVGTTKLQDDLTISGSTPAIKLIDTAGVANEAFFGIGGNRMTLYTGRLNSARNDFWLRVGDSANSSTATIFASGSTGFVGIGNEAPARRLHIGGTGGSTGGIMLSPSSGDVEIQFQDSGTTNAYITLKDGTQQMRFRDDSANVLNIDFGTEKVGIGTTSPTDKLDIFSSGANARLLRLSHPAAPTSASMFLGFNQGAGAIDNLVATVGVQYSNDYYNVINIDRSNRNVGIGNTAPTQALTVQGNISASGAINVDGAITASYFKGDGSGLTNVTSTASPLQDVLNSGNTAGGTGIAMEGGGIDMGAGDITAIGHISGSTMQLGSTAYIMGNVGIGTTNPGSKLQIGQSYQTTAGTHNEVLLNMGGYYSTSAGRQYSVLGFTGTTVDSTNIFVQSGSETGKNFYAGLVADSGYFNGSRFSIIQSGSERFTIAGPGVNEGNVGIGTTNPGYKLDVKSGGTSTFFTSFTPSAGSGFIRIYQDSNSHLSIYGANSAGTTNLVLNTNGVSYIKGGNVIVGGSADNGNTFQVQGNSSITGNLTVDGIVTAQEFHTEFVSASIIYQSGSTKFGNSSDDIHQFTGSVDISAPADNGIRIVANNALIGGGASGGDTQLLYWNGSIAYYGRSSLGGSVSQHEFRTGGATRLTVSSSGYVGIGTTQPSQTLDVNGTALIRSGMYVANWIQNWGDGGTGLYFETDKVSLRTNGGTQQLVVSGSSGNVGIGTTSPSAKLHVSGGYATDALYVEGYVNGMAYGQTDRFTLKSNTRLWFYDSNAEIYRDTSTLRVYGNHGITLNFSASQGMTVGSTAASRGILDVVTPSRDRYPGLVVSSSGWGAIGTPMAVFDGGPLGDGDILKIKGLGNRTDAKLFQVEGASGTAVLVRGDGNVGIGTTSPQRVLDVKLPNSSAIGASIAGQLSVGNYQGLHFGYSESGNNLYRKSAIVFERTDLTSNNAQGKIHILNGPQSGAASATLADAKLTIAENGNVGIGTTAPSASLHVSGTYDVVKIEGSGSTNSSSLFEVHGNNGLLFAIDDDLSDSLFSVNTIAGLPVIEAFSDNRVVMGAYNQNDFVISGSKIGIGTDAPQKEVHVSGSGGVELYVNSSGGASSYSRVGVYNEDDGAGHPGAYAYLQSNGWGEAKVQIASNYIQQAGGKMIFYSAGQVAQFSTGNVGIGTGTPAEKLTVVGNISASGAINVEGAITASYFKGDGSGLSNVTAAASSLQEVLNAGNTAGGTGIEMEGGGIDMGAGDITNVGNLSGSVVLVNPGSVSSPSLAFGNDTDTGLFWGSANTLKVAIGGSEKARIDTNGMGIASGNIYIASGYKANFDYGTSNDYFLRKNSSNLEVYSAGNVAIGAGSATKMFVSSSGNVGIGSTSPAATLEIYKSGSTDLLRIGDGTNYMHWYGNGYNDINTYGSSFRVYAHTNDIVFRTGGADPAVTIKNGGNMGIGTASPGAKLHVNGDVVRIVNSTYAGFEGHNTNGTWETFIGTESGGGGNRYNAASSKHTFYANSTAVMTISGSDGKVGIGTTAPDYKLDVAGEVGIDSYIRHNGDTDTYFGFNAADSFKIRLGNGDRTVMTTTDTTFSTNTTSTGYLQSYGLFYHRNNIVVLNKAENGWITWASRQTGGADTIIDLSNIGRFESSGSATIDGNLTVSGIVTAQEFHTEFVSASIVYQSGSTKFGDTSDDDHDFTGSLNIQGDIRTKNSGRLYLWNDNNSNYLDYINWIASSGTTQTIQNTGIGGITFKTLTDTRMYISASGNVGIGTTSPAKTLVVNKSNSGAAGGYIRLENTVGGAGANVGLDFATFSPEYYAGSLSSTDPVAQIQATDISNYSGRLDIKVRTQGTSGTLATLATFHNNGNVGIGVTAPQKRLTLGSTQLDGIQFNYDTTDNYRNQILNYWNSNTDSRMDFNIARTSGQTPETILSVGYGGNVGIGTTSPSAKLHVSQSGNGTSNSLIVEDDARKLKIGRDSVAAYDKADAATTMYLNSGANISMNSSAGNTVIGATGVPSNAKFAVVGNISGSGDLFIKGNVGIGTTSPSQKLEVSGQAVINGGTGVASSGTLIVRQKGNTSNDGIALTSGHATSHRIWKDVNGTLNFGPSTAASSFVQDLSGNVGIGTTSPAYRLDVSGSAFFNGGLDSGSIGNAIGNFAIIVPAAQTPNPGAYRHILGTTEGSVANMGLFGVDDGSGGAQGFAIATGDNTAISERFRITSAGNVGIGTSSPTEKLDVNGNVRVNGTLEATEKSFNIEHPTQPGKRLIYGVLEGPEHGVYVRGTGTANIIELPEVWTGLVHEDTITVQLTCKGKPYQIWVEDIRDNRVYINTDVDEFEFYYFIQAERKDVDKLIIERDAN